MTKRRDRTGKPRMRQIPRRVEMSFGVSCAGAATEDRDGTLSIRYISFSKLYKASPPVGTVLVGSTSIPTKSSTAGLLPSFAKDKTDEKIKMVKIVRKSMTFGP